MSMLFAFGALVKQQVEWSSPENLGTTAVVTVLAVSRIGLLGVASWRVAFGVSMMIPSIAVRDLLPFNTTLPRLEKLSCERKSSTRLFVGMVVVIGEKPVLPDALLEDRLM